jgi:hypothetical protein
MQAALRAALKGVTAEQLPGAPGSSTHPLHTLDTLPSIQHEQEGEFRCFKHGVRVVSCNGFTGTGRRMQATKGLMCCRVS